MASKNTPADAWEDDWESLADKEDEKPVEEQPKKLTKAQLKAQHAELNKQLWQAAENPEPQWYPEVHPAPVAATFKPKVTMLARKPTPQVLSRNMAGMSLDDDDSEEERRKKAAADFEERKARAQKERAEKERKYAEARERIFGSPAASAAEDSRSNSPNKATRGKGRGRGGRDSQPRSSNEQSPARTAHAAPPRQLFDPTYTPKPGSVFIQKKESGISRPSTPNTQEKPVRQPQGPARGGGRGFAPRGGYGTQADYIKTKACKDFPKSFRTMAPQSPEQSIEQSTDQLPPPKWTYAHTATLQDDLAKFTYFINHQVGNLSEHDPKRKELQDLIKKEVDLDDMMGHIAALHPQVYDYGVAGEIQGVAQEIPTKKGALPEHLQPPYRDTERKQMAREKTRMLKHPDSTPETSGSSETPETNTPESAEGSHHDEGDKDYVP
ncbi:hypothetical protein J4E85_007740 [Alternaria conjuncta]|uniref:uncharacterized protein n=1 Tax=Alternaria conjuncta TaxID=181017 RepID=UPI00221FBA5D|nr:uncharacterized protein J4E85_007740 [Alternaria conjuncta]KAI4924623.1 hypothetical protein J4E85_007740 [Alternaria conjuncta]